MVVSVCHIQIMAPYPAGTVWLVYAFAIAVWLEMENKIQSGVSNGLVMCVGLPGYAQS